MEWIHRDGLLLHIVFQAGNIVCILYTLRLILKEISFLLIFLMRPAALY